MKDLVNQVSVVNALTSATVHAATQNGTAVNTSGFEAVAFAVFVGAPGDTLSGTNKYEIDVQESQDGTNFTAAADINVQYAVGTANGAANNGAGALLTSGTVAQVIQIGYLGIAPFVRVSVTGSGTLTTGTSFSAVAVLGHARHQPSQLVQTP